MPLGRKNPGLTKLRNIDLTDRELLHVIRDCADGEGMTLAEDVAGKLGIKSNGKRTPAGTVSTRLSWMRRYGFVDRIDPKTLGLRAADPPRWIITDLGRALMGGRISATMQRELERGEAGTQLLVMRELGRGYASSRNFGFAAAIRREWLHNAARRPR